MAELDNDTVDIHLFISECLGHCVIDSGCTSCVAGSVWVSSFLESLPENDKSVVKSYTSSKKYRFGDGEEFPVMERINMPVYFGSTRAILTVDVVSAKVPLLLSNQSLQKGNAKIDFENRTLTILDETVGLIETSTGHFIVPIRPPSEVPSSILLTANFSASDMLYQKRNKVAKLHRQFAHPPAYRLRKLLLDSGVNDSVILDLVEEVTKSCQTCQQLQPKPSRPVVGFPTASEFNETVALDPKVFKTGNYLLHMIDHATRYSSGCLIFNKKKETIVEGIMSYWVKWFGTPKKCLSDNGGEFINDELIDLAEKCNITIKTTAAESPWSNGMCERHNAIISRNIHKVRLDVGCSMETALAWSISAKNSLANVHGFSPNQLFFGQNPRLPTVMENNPPGNNTNCVSKVLEKHLHALHSARAEFVKAEACEKIKRALSKKTRSYSDMVYCNGDSVYFKRLSADVWHGPAKVLGRDGQMYLLKQGGLYVRVHPCRMAPVYSQLSESLSSSKSPSHDADAIQSSPVPSTPCVNCVDCSDDDLMIDPVPNSESDPVSLSGPEVQHELISTQCRGPVQNHADLPKLKDIVSYRLSESDPWKTGCVTSRGGKVGGRHWHFLNMQSTDDGTITPVSFRDEVYEWKNIDATSVADANETSQDELLFVYLGKHTSSDKFLGAKMDEIEKWKQMNVYKEVADDGYSLMSTRWVCTEKLKGGVMVFKARLVARRFEEDQSELTRNSPTCTKDSFRILLSVLSSFHWKIHSIDIKSAFLQGKPLDRDIYLKPPKEANTQNVWKLNQAVYGLSDAGRHWYDQVKASFLKIGLVVSKLDKAVFTYSVDGVCHGVIIAHVDDFLFGGDNLLHMLIISKIRKMFVVGLEESKI